MPIDYDKEIKLIKDSIENAKNMKYKAEVRLEHLNKEKDELLGKIKELGIEPEQLESEIKKIRNEINELIKKAKDLIPEEFLKNIKA